MPQLPPDFYAPKPDPDAALMENLEWLRYHVRVASGQMRAHSAREMQQPSAATTIKTQGQLTADQPI